MKNRELCLPHVFRDSDDNDLDNTELRHAQTKMIDAMTRCEKSLELLGTFMRGVTPMSAHSSLPTLPLEIIQYIAAIAYENERIHKCGFGYGSQEIDFREVGDSGVMGFATHLRTIFDGDLFPMTRLAVISNRPRPSQSGLMSLDRAPEARYHVVFLEKLDDRSDLHKRDNTTRFARQRGSEMKSLEVKVARDLIECSPVLPFVEHLSYLNVAIVDETVFHRDRGFSPKLSQRFPVCCENFSQVAL